MAKLKMIKNHKDYFKNLTCGGCGDDNVAVNTDCKGKGASGKLTGRPWHVTGCRGTTETYYLEHHKGLLKSGLRIQL